MLNLIICEIKKLKKSKIVGISILGVLSTPFMMFVEALQTHFEHPDRIITLADIYDNSLLYVMLLTNMMIYVAITAYLFSREYAERTLKTILPIPVSRKKLLESKFFTLFLWMNFLTFLTWLGIFLLSGIYQCIFGMGDYNLVVAFIWLIKFIVGNFMMFVTLSPFSYIAQKSKGFVAPIIFASVIVMGSAALCNQRFGALYPWTATFFITKGNIASKGYPLSISILSIAFVGIAGLILTFRYFNNEDLK